jgi:hypothetical protein
MTASGNAEAAIGLRSRSERPPDPPILDVGRQDAELRLHVLGDLEVDELLDEPPGLPDRVVAAEQNAILVEPVQERADDLREGARPRVHERDRHGRPGVDVRLLRGDPAEVLRARRPTCPTMKFSSGSCFHSAV